MKRLWLALLFTPLLLGGCAIMSLIPVSSSGGESPTPVIITEMPVEVVTEVPTAEPVPTEAPSVHWIAFLGSDGNIWLVNPETTQQQQLTSDAQTYSDASAVVVSYNTPAWSSDGRYLAFDRELGTRIPEGYDFTFSTMVYDASTGEIRTLLEENTAGYAWQPGTHLLAYARSADPNYFVTRGGVDSALATGIWTVDADSGVVAELVQPEAGYALVSPQWSPNGQILSFNELIYMEGRGPFAFYDFSASSYVRWEESIGSVAWLPSASGLLYDMLNYAPSYEERIHSIHRDRTGSVQISPDMVDGYAFYPLVSPDGSTAAYLSAQGMDNSMTTVVVQDLATGERRELATFTQVFHYAWAVDGASLLVSAGAYPDMKVMQISLADGMVKVLAGGWQAAMQP